MTVAEPVMRLTFAPLTPAVVSSERCTLPLHAAQLIPDTGMVHWPAGARSRSSCFDHQPAMDHPHAAGEFVAPGLVGVKSTGVVWWAGRNERMPKSGNTTSSVQLFVSFLKNSRRTGRPARTFTTAGEYPPLTSIRTRCGPVPSAAAATAAPRPARKK